MQNKIQIGETTILDKVWGQEVIIINSPLYTSKILRYKTGGISSGHFHLKKTETWLIYSGKFLLTMIDPVTANRQSLVLAPNQTVHIPNGCFHKLQCLLSGDILESSTEHFDDDTYRIEPSQVSNP